MAVANQLMHVFHTISHNFSLEDQVYMNINLFLKVIAPNVNHVVASISIGTPIDHRLGSIDLGLRTFQQPSASP